MDFRVFDVETVGLYGEPLCFSIADESGVRAYPWTDFKSEMVRDCVFVAHNAKYDLTILLDNGFGIKDLIVFDPMIAARFLNYPQYGLKALTEQLLGRSLRVWKDFFGGRVEAYEKKFPGGGLWDKFDDKLRGELLEYCSQDAEATLELAKIFAGKLKFEGLGKVSQIENRVIVPSVYMGWYGFRVDRSYLSKQLVYCGAALEMLGSTLCKMASDSGFNPRSSRQVAEVLFGVLEAPCFETTPGGKPSTKERALVETKIALRRTKREDSKAYKFVDVLLEHRGYQKNKGFLEGLLKASVGDGRVHSNFDPLGAKTGRFSSREPNLQQIPKGDVFGIRGAFIPSDGKELWSIDWSQVEIRIAAYLSQDAVLLKAFKAGEDVHQATANWFKVNRQTGKIINFALFYGMSPWSLASILQVSETEAKKLYNEFFELYSGIREYHFWLAKEVKKKGYAETMFGRRLYVPDIYSENKGAYASAIRRAKDFGPQGTCADMMKIALRELFEIEGLWLVNSVHDEVIFEVADGDAATVQKAVVCMESVIDLGFPLECELAPFWGGQMQKTEEEMGEWLKSLGRKLEESLQVR